MKMNVLSRAAALALEFFSRIGKCFNDSMPQATGMKKQKTQGPSLGLSFVKECERARTPAKEIVKEKKKKRLGELE
jgi:hypothetical protein